VGARCGFRYRPEWEIVYHAAHDGLISIDDGDLVDEVLAVAEMSLL
jgi:hypothetical protein